MIKLSRSSQISQRRKRQSRRNGGRPTPQSGNNDSDSDSERNSVFANQSPEDIQEALDLDFSPVPDMALPGVPPVPQNDIDLSFTNLPPLPPIPNLPPPPISDALPTFGNVPQKTTLSKSSSMRNAVKTKSKSRRNGKKVSRNKNASLKIINAPLGCVQNKYNMISKTGKKFVSKRCVNSKNSKVNDNVVCIINRKTNRCNNK